ncbi:MAG: M28 family peptidase, partial [Fidelibacterota bacterium]
KTPIPGANDGASGVAVLLELANIMNQHPPPKGVDIVLFDGEDMGRRGDLDSYCIGSKYFAENIGSSKPEYAIVLDMVGDAFLEIPMERYSYEKNPELVNMVWKAAEKAGIKQFKRYLGQYVYDDHIRLIEYAEIKAVDIIDFSYPDRSNRYWHTQQDTPDKCSPESLEAVGKLVLELIYNY